MQDMPIHARDATFFAQDWPRSVASYQFFIDRKHRDARICFASGAGRHANCDGAAPAAQSCDAPRFRTETLYAGMRACGHAGGVACAAPITRIVKCTVAQVFPVHTCAVATKRRRFHVCPGIDAVMPRCLDPATYQRYATDIWYCRPAIGRPMNTPPVAAPGTRTLPSVRPSVSVTLLPLAVTSQCSPTCRLAPMSSMS